MDLFPSSPAELAAQLAEASAKRQSITLRGNGTKDGMAGPVEASDVTISTSRLDRVLQYEPRDLTVSVEAGISWSEFVIFWPNTDKWFRSVRPSPTPPRSAESSPRT